MNRAKWLVDYLVQFGGSKLSAAQLLLEKAYFYNLTNEEISWLNEIIEVLQQKAIDRVTDQ